MTGLRPIAELMFSDFFAVAWDMVANQIAKTRYMTDGQVSLPLVLRTANGGGPALRRAAQPERRELGDGDPGAEGRRARRRPADMKGLLAAAIRDPDPVIVCEHKACSRPRARCPTASTSCRSGRARDRPRGRRRARSSRWRHGPAGARGRGAPGRRARHRRRGHRPALAGPARRAGDPRDRSRRPAACSPSRRTRALCGWGAEIVSIVADEGFWSLDAPIVRITTPHVPLPSAAALEDLAMPSRRPDRRHGPAPARRGALTVSGR